MYTIHIFPWNDGVHVKKYSTEKYNIFTWFTDKDDDNEDESSESKGEDGKDLEGIFDDVPLDNSDIQQAADDTQFSPILDTPPNTITVDVEVHTPVVSLNIFYLDVKLFATWTCHFSTEKLQYFAWFTENKQILQYAMVDTETTDHQWEQFYRN